MASRAGSFDQDQAHMKVDSEWSETRRGCRVLDAMRRFRSDAPVDITQHEARHVRAATALVQWAYGCRERRVSEGSTVTRRAPSAGRLYPTEIFLLGSNRDDPRLLYLDKERTALHEVVGDPRRLTELLEPPGPGVVAILTTAFSRSAERYGARAYQYCMLDAAHVAANLLQAAAFSGLDARPLAAGATRDLESAIGLQQAEGFVLAIHMPTGSSPEPLWPPHVPCPEALHPEGEQCSREPELAVIAGAHRQAASAARQPTLSWTSTWFEGKFDKLVDSRASAAGFAQTCVPSSVVRQISDSCVRLLEAAREDSGLPLHAYLLALRVDGLEEVAYHLTPRGPEPVIQTEAAQPALRFGEACQGQRTAHDTSFAVALGLPRDALHTTRYAGLRDAALELGAVGAGLYRVAAELGVATSTIGGFRETGIADLVGVADFHAVAVQAFGIERTNVPKTDAVTQDGGLTA